MILPTPHIRPTEVFWTAFRVQCCRTNILAAIAPPGLEVRRTCIDTATSFNASVMTVRANKSAIIEENKHQHQLMSIFVLCGSAILATGDDCQTKQLRARTSITLPRLLDFKLKISSEDTRRLVVESPASNRRLIATTRGFA